MASRVNTSMWNYRQELEQALRLEGHHLTIVTSDFEKLLPIAITALDESHSEVIDQDVAAQIALHHLCSGKLTLSGYEFLHHHHDLTLIEQVKVAIAATREHNQQQEAIAVSTALDISAAEYDFRKDQRAKTLQDHYVERKHELQKRYPISVTPQLKLKDDAGWYAQLRLHYYLTHDPTLVRLRDLKEWQGHLDRGEGKVALQDVRLLTAQVETFKALSILNLLDPDRQVRASDADVEQIRQQAVQYCHDLKTILNLTISAKMTPIEIVQGLLGKLGLRLTCVGRDVAADGRRGGARVYQYQPPNDDRDAIFAEWQQRDAEVQASLMAACDQSLTQLPVSTIDPPPDRSTASRSPCGSKSVATDRKFLSQAERLQQKASPQESSIETSPRSQASGIRVGCVVRHLRQTCEWIVVQVEKAKARLKQLHSTSEFVAPLDELVLVAIEAGGEPNGPTAVD